MEVIKWNAKNTADAINASMQKMTATQLASGATEPKLYIVLRYRVIRE
jgi:hypothetical protein